MAVSDIDRGDADAVARRVEASTVIPMTINGLPDIPVHADMHDIDVIFVAEPDHLVSPLGGKGLGEIGLVGTAAAIANAVYHATGQRVRDLPITIDKLMRH